MNELGLSTNKTKPNPFSAFLSVKSYLVLAIEIKSLPLHTFSFEREKNKLIIIRQ